MPSAQPGSPELLPSSTRPAHSGPAQEMCSVVRASMLVPGAGSSPRPAGRPAGRHKREMGLEDGSGFSASPA